MPNGNVHRKTTLASGIIIFATCIYFGQSFAKTIATTLGCLLGILLTPDLDLTENRWNYFTFRNFLERPFRWLWFLYWTPYALIPHRSVWSHMAIIGTIGRVIYIGLPIALIMYGLNVPFPDSNIMLWALIGLMISDLVHLVLDITL